MSGKDSAGAYAFRKTVGLMLTDLSVILVVDVQSTDSAAPVESASPAGAGEIVEIGIASVDAGALRVHQLDDLIVKPAQSRSAVMAGHAPNLPEQSAGGGVPFNEACRIIKRRYLAQDVTWASWSSNARTRFERQCRAQAIPYPFGQSHIDVSNLFALAHHLPEMMAVPQALEYARLPTEAPSMRAHHAARDVARLLISVLQRCRR